VLTMKPADWKLAEETLRLDSEATWFERALRTQIGGALRRLRVDESRKGRVIVTLSAKDWDVLRETLEADARSSAFDRELREGLQGALGRVHVAS
jgi:hypothetical protein